MSLFDSLFDSLPREGWLKRSEAELLLRAASESSGTILEVGCYHGRATVLLASLGRPLISVDPFSGFNTCDLSGERARQAFLKNLALYSNVRLVVTRIEDWVTEPLGFAYLDGDHTYLGTVRQIKVALECNPQSLCLHDYCHQGGGLAIKQAIESCPRIQLTELVDSMALCKVLK